MMVGVDLLHPEDVLYFAEVAAAMRRVAARENLPLRSIGHLSDRDSSCETDRHGCCDAQGNIKLLIRGREDGQWTERMEHRRVWNVAAHELAHLKHFNHSIAHREYTDELEQMLTNTQEDHRQKVLKKLVKMQAQQASEKKIGNAEAADTFARMINKMLLENELNPTDIDYARSGEDDPVIELLFDQPRYGLKLKKMRSAWRESLAQTVANSHLCRFMIRPGSNDIWFVGTKSHATVAEYAYGVLVSAAEKVAEAEYDRYYKQLRYKEGKEVAGGFKGSWLSGFVTRIRQRFDEERQKAVEEYRARTVEVGGDPGTALVRLDGALIKVREYIDERYGKRRRRAEHVSGYHKDHSEGRAWGRAAADRMSLGRKGIGSTTIRGQLGE